MAKKEISKTTVKKTTVKEIKAISTSKSTKNFRTDAKQVAVLERAGRTSAANAIRASKALGLSITYMQKGIIYKEHTDGTKQIIAASGKAKAAAKQPLKTLKKGMILYAKK